MEDKNSPCLKIPFETLEDHIQCSICLSAIKGAVLTSCGHRYCYKCIQEWTDREHSCPCCKKQLLADKFYYDVQFDGLVEQMLKERDKAEQEHFNRMFDQATSQPEAGGTTTLSPFQEILRKHLKKSMISIEHYFYKLQHDFQQKVSRLQSGIIPTELRGSSNDPGEIRLQLERHMEQSEKLAAESLDRYLSNNIPPLEFLPVSVSVYVNDKQIRLPNVTFKPTDRISDIKPKLEGYIVSQNEEITLWNESECVILLVSPLTKKNHYSIEELLNGVDQGNDVTLLSWDSQPILQHYMRPGSEIVVHKAFKLQADEPLKCYVKLFSERGAQPVDYFSCEDCNSKWICKACAQGCHAGHTITPFVLKHTPSWGCCYCPKKKLCKIQSTG